MNTYDPEHPEWDYVNIEHVEIDRNQLQNLFNALKPKKEYVNYAFNCTINMDEDFENITNLLDSYFKTKNNTNTFRNKF
jgi:hypothetical protein